MSKYTPTIGIETHVQLKTKTKLFAAIDNDAREAKPNTLISHICVGMPGALPVLNQKALELAVRAGLALDGEPQKFTKFDRKHYFYPDLPKGYQITQYDDPIVKGGKVEIEVDGKKTSVGITRVHLEEDAGKTTHPVGADYSLVDLNRAGTPLLEIVSQPDIHSPAQAKAYARELYLIMKYADVTDGDLYHGHIRFDVNVSVSADPTKHGTRTETKNLNSFRAVENAVAYEIKRQTEELEKGNQIIQETRGWDEAKQKTISQRGKEEAEDYRYMPEPDIPPVVLSDKFILEIKKQTPMLPDAYRKAFKTLQIGNAVIEDVIIISPHTSYLLHQILIKYGVEHAKRLCVWISHSFDLLTNNMLKPSSQPIKEEAIIKLSNMLDKNIISARSAREIWIEMVQNGGDPLTIAKEKNYVQVSDEVQIESIVAEVIAENPKAAQDVKNGEAKAIGFLVGQVMAKSKGQANPGLSQQIIKKQLGVK